MAASRRRCSIAAWVSRYGRRSKRASGRRRWNSRSPSCGRSLPDAGQIRAEGIVHHGGAPHRHGRRTPDRQDRPASRARHDDLPHFRPLAVGTMQKPCASTPSGRIELAAEVFQRDGRRQLDDLRLGEVLLELGEQGVVDLSVGVVMRSAYSSATRSAGLNSLLSRQFRTSASFSRPPSLSVTRTELMSIQNGQPLIDGDADIDQRQQRLGQLARLLDRLRPAGRRRAGSAGNAPAPWWD